VTPGWQSPSLRLPAAALMQRGIIDRDLDMVEFARLRHPAVRWWWGQRVIAKVNGAYCYLCDKHVATWARAWPITNIAVGFILGHRDAHIAATITSLGSPASVSLAGADATTTGGTD